MASDHSTKPDILTGWQGHDLVPKIKQFPTIFVNPPVDMLTKSLTSFGNNFSYRVIYMGPRHTSNMKVFKSYCKNSKHQYIYHPRLYQQQQIQRFPFHHSHQSQKFFPIRTSQYRLFSGMNPTLKKDDLRFDADFECGNLDLVIYVNPVEYDLLMRVDSNTKGHTAWFFFKVIPNNNTCQKVKFNIINFGKKELLYKDGMRPYVFKKSIGKWEQSCISVNYQKKRFRYEGSQQVLSQCLSFIYEFKDSEPVYFSYCIPYSYSYLRHRLKYYEQKVPHLMKVQYNQSTGGVQIPLLTITNFSTAKNKDTILVTGRLHPGQSQGSWMVDGFLQFILSPEGHYLRERNIFKIIPMVNVDGVILGNFRTGIMGRDLNRSFCKNQPYNQIKLIKRIGEQLKPTIFLDFHGHSAKRNVFIYGPEYRLEDRYYLPSRVLPKMIAKNCSAFRYYSCVFKIPSSKKTTGRAVMLNQLKVPFSFTVQASTHAYGFAKNQCQFSVFQYREVGQKIGLSLGLFIKFLRILPKREEIRLEKQKEKQKKQKEKEKQEKEKERRKILKNSGKQLENYHLSMKQYTVLNNEEFGAETKELLQQILKDQIQIEKEEKNEELQESDCEDQNEDYSGQELKSIIENKYESMIAQKQIKKKKVKEKRKAEKDEKLEENKEGKKEEKVQEKKEEKKYFYFKEEKVKSVKDFLNENKLVRKKMHNSQTIDVLPETKGKNKISRFEEKQSQILKRNPDYLQSIIKKPKGLSRIQSQEKDIIQSFMSDERTNFVHYDWSHKKHRQSYQHFDFQIAQSDEIIKKTKFPLKKKQSLERKKKTPILSIKKSILPMLGRKYGEESVPENEEKSMLNQILEEHERKKKKHKNVKIMFL